MVPVANHISHFDPLFLGIAFKRTIDWMTTEEFYDNPLLGAWLRALNTFPVDRSRPDRRALRLGVERLRAGRMVGMFPRRGDSRGRGFHSGRRCAQEWRGGARAIGVRPTHSVCHLGHRSTLCQTQLAAGPAAHAGLGNGRRAVFSLGSEE